ncbi:unnamed protein product [Calypogeia fissa]
MEETEAGPPRSFPITTLQDLHDRSYFNSANFEFNKSSVPLQKRGGTSGEKRPRLLACHDLKGGYVDDQWIQGSPNAGAYTLTHWRLLDIFVYFSHKLVTLPPPGWTNTAHRHGVQVLGTFITEWDEGKSLCKKLLASKESLRMYADRLAELAETLGFDGWLINIENVIAKAQVANLLEFVRYLSVRMHSAVPGSLVIWYDSVTTEGKLEWQDWLNVLNKPFFDVCDGIYTNYTWKSDYPKLSASAAGNRAFDVYMGVDVFGRGSYGGGQFHCDVALNVIREAGVSAALFAPGWAYETNEDESRWWNSIENCWPAARPDPVQLPFFTDFDVGLGIAKCIDAKQVSDLPWSNLSCQNLQPLLHVAGAAAPDSGVHFTVSLSQESAVYNGGVCIKAVGDVGHDEVCIVQLYHTETIIDEASLNVSFSFKSQSSDSSFCLALSAQDSKGSKVIYFLLDSKDDVDSQSFPRNHHFSHVLAVFEHMYEGHNPTSSSDRGGHLQSYEPFTLDPLVSGDKWTVRDFMLEWGNYTLVDIFGICSSSKGLRPILIKLLREDETLFDRETFTKQMRRSTEQQQSNLGRGGSATLSFVEESTPSKDANVEYCLRIGHLSIAPSSHEHLTPRDLEIVGYHPSWLVGEGGDRFLSVNLRWELSKTGVGSGDCTSRKYHLFATIGPSDEDKSSASETYLGMTMLSVFYVYMLPLPKSSSSVTFNLQVQCPCGKVLPVSNVTYTLSVPTHESGRYVRTQPSLSDWLFRESH